MFGLQSQVFKNLLLNIDDQSVNAIEVIKQNNSHVIYAHYNYCYLTQMSLCEICETKAEGGCHTLRRSAYCSVNQTKMESK